MTKKFPPPFALALALVALVPTPGWAGPRVASPPVQPPVLPQPVSVTVEATGPDAYAAGGVKGVFTVRRTLGEDLGPALTVRYRVGGTAVGGTQYRVLSGVLTLPLGRTEARVKVKPLPDGTAAGSGTTTVKLTLLPGDGYEVGDPGRAKVKVHAGAAAP